MYNFDYENELPAAKAIREARNSVFQKAEQMYQNQIRPKAEEIAKTEKSLEYAKTNLARMQADRAKLVEEQKGLEEAYKKISGNECPQVQSMY